MTLAFTKYYTPHRAPEPEKMGENDCLLPHDLDNLVNGPTYDHGNSRDWWDTVQVSSCFILYNKRTM